MKKYVSLFLLGLFSLVLWSCSSDDDNNNGGDGDTYSVVYDMTDSFVVNSDGSTKTIGGTFGNLIPTTDVVLVYRQQGVDNGNPVWRQLPITYYLTEGELDYTFDFTRADVQIYVDGTMDFRTQNSNFVGSYLNNQKFRVVIVPASAGAKNAKVDYSDYNSVIKHFNIDDSHPKVLK